MCQYKLGGHPLGSLLDLRLCYRGCLQIHVSPAYPMRNVIAYLPPSSKSAFGDQYIYQGRIVERVYWL